MSLNTRVFWIYPVIVVASWMAVRTLSASAADQLDDPPAPMTQLRSAPEIRDPALARLISRFATTARAEWR